MKIEIKKVFPEDTSNFFGYRIIRLISFAYILVMIARSCIHLFSHDGGATSIAGVDTSIEGGDNIIAMFHQWGAIQLILAALLCLLFFRYPGLTPLILLTLLFDPILRYVSGHLMPLTTAGTPPGEALNGASFFLLAILFIGSLVSK